ncbi:MAG: hypothetical protein Ta2F_18750 [Termitinemataceae bacterium]|nr:MAG: hypothetical protein Ta2F_18750 [Termitinemataceae bacterium]
MENVSKIITSKELSLILNISEFTIMKLARSKELPCKFEKQNILFEFDSLIEYLQSKEKTT